MLSLNNGLPLAIINEDKNKKIYHKEADNDAEPEIDTDQEQKTKIFKKFLERDDKLKKTEIDELVKLYKNGITEHDDRKISKYLEKGIDYVNKSLKRYLDFPKDISLFPIITEPTYRLGIFGLSGSGKSRLASDFLKFNKPLKGAGIFLFSPVQNDDSIKIKNIIHIKLERYYEDFEKDFELEDLPKGSVCIFDDCDTYDKRYRELYQETRNKLLERGRHLGISTIIIQHQAQQGNRGRSDIVLRECQFYAIFPKYNVRDSQNLLKNYTSMTNTQIEEVMNINSRWCFIRKSVPAYFIGQHSIGLI
jgi:hypothetical protein